MDIRQILLARSIQFFRIPSAGYLPEVAQKIKDRYEFVVGPKDEDLLGSEKSEQTKGAEFKHGRLKNPVGRELIIQQLAIFPDGLVVDTTTSTEDADFFIGDFYEWAKAEITAEIMLGSRLYVSDLEFEASNPLELYAPAFRSAGNAITNLLRSYGRDIAAYHFSQVKLSIDPIGAVPPQPATFQIERRANVPFKDNMWFSEAPLKTQDHIKILRDLDSASSTTFPSS